MAWNCSCKSEQIDNNSIYITLDFILTPIIMGFNNSFFWENKNEENTLKIKFLKILICY